jgi:dsRNA-specific ribonuclease
LGFKNFLLISSHVERISGRDNPRFLEDTLESFIGVLYKDQKSNLNICRAFLLAVYDKHLNLDDLININDNYKDSLLRYFHSKSWGHPEYISEETANKEFKSIINIDISLLDKNTLEKIKTCPRDGQKIILGKGQGKTKKIAQQECSKNCLLNLKISTNY